MGKQKVFNTRFFLKKPGAPPLLTMPELKAVVEALCKKKKAGYQEALGW
ncbi:hypothetical protein [Oceanobacillus rekensis]|nr:hypothetical protein [Oceanobacillus rekensis]